MNRFFLLLLLNLVLIIVGCQTSITSPYDLASLEGELRYSSDVKKGILANGFSYYLARNTLPEKQVYIYFVVNAGSMNEEEDQKGVAHIVEHMAFNGTTLFPRNNVILELEKVGMKFGADINAFTDFENTVYSLSLPNNDRNTLDLALTVVAQWASQITIKKSDLDEERGVVLEEWRSRLGPMLRLGDKKSAIEMAGSRYALRDPIGNVEIIKNVSRQRVADYYHRWYRPDNMSVVVVGDININSILTMLEQKLAHQKIPQVSMPVIDYEIPLINKWRSKSVYEPSIATPAIELSFFTNYKEDNSLENYKKDFASQIASRLINVRLQKFEQDYWQLIKTANFYTSNIGKHTTKSTYSLQLNQQNYNQAIMVLFNFLAEIKQNKFGKKEFNEEVNRLHLLNEKNLDKPQYSANLASNIMISTASQQILLSKQDKYKLNKAILNKLTLDDVYQAFTDIIETSSRLVLATQTNSHFKSIMSDEKLKKAWHEALQTVHKPWQLQNNQLTEMPTFEIKEGKIESKNKVVGQDIIEYQLSNGSKLVYYYNAKDKGKVFFKALTSGGLRSIPYKDFHLLRVAASLVDETGFGKLSLSDVKNLFNHSPIVMSTLLDDFYQGYSGWAEIDNLEKILIAFHFKLNDSYVSEQILTKYKTEMQQQLVKDQKDSQYQFTRQISKVRYPKQRTIYDLTAKDIDSFTAKKLTSAYHQYLTEKTDYTYFIAGDISEQQVEELAKKYLASVHVHHSTRTTLPLYAHSPQKELVIKNSSEPRAEVEIYLTHDKTWNYTNSYYLELAGELVQEKLRAKLREQASGVYSITSWFWHNPQDPQAEARIIFSCDPKRVNELINMTKQVLQDIEENDIEHQTFNNKVAQSKDSIKRLHQSVQGKLDMIEKSYMLTNGPSLINANLTANQLITEQKVKQVLSDFLKNANIFTAILMPEPYVTQDN